MALLVRIFVAGVKGLLQTITVSGITIHEGGLQRKRWKEVVFYPWEDVVRYEAYRLDFGLAFKNGEKIRFPVEMKDSKEIKNFILDRIEQIGTFEDGRKVARELWSVSIKTLLWICIAVVALIMLIICRK